MKKLSAKRLEVKRETLRRLSRVALSPVVGGAIVASKTNDGQEAQCGPSGGGCQTGNVQRMM
jgi:hypothetical protein